jgi:hypothetical protein
VAVVETGALIRDFRNSAICYFFSREIPSAAESTGNVVLLPRRLCRSRCLLPLPGRPTAAPDNGQYAWVRLRACVRARVPRHGVPGGAGSRSPRCVLCLSVCDGTAAKCFPILALLIAQPVNGQLGRWFVVERQPIHDQRTYMYLFVVHAYQGYKRKPGANEIGP